MAVNIAILILDFLFVKSMPTAVMYGSLIWVMISTPILLYIAMRSARERIESKNVK